MGGTEQAAGLGRYLLNVEIMGAALSDLPAIIGRYLLSIEVSDVLDIALMVFVLYKLLTLVQSTKAASL